MSKIIEITLFHPRFQEGSSAMEEYRRWLNKQCEECTEQLAKIGAEAARATYGGANQSIKVTVENRGKEASVVASGQGVGFVEFGTGAYADSAHPYARVVPFDVYKGSWSDTEGAGTWSAWLAAGKDEESYPYNTVPRRGMWEATKAMQRESNNVAQKAFKFVWQ